LYDSHKEVGKGGHFDVLEDPFDDVSLCSDELEHLQRVFELATRRCRKAVVTSAGFLLRNTALILANCAAIVILVFISSDVRSSTVSQKGINSWSVLLRQVSTIDQISLQSTSVAT
jgi:hypothetical protein